MIGKLDYGKTNKELLKKGKEVHKLVHEALSNNKEIRILTDSPDIKVEDIWFRLEYNNSSHKTIVNRHYSLDKEIELVVETIVSDIVGRRP